MLKPNKGAAHSQAKHCLDLIPRGNGPLLTKSTPARISAEPWSESLGNRQNTSEDERPY